MIHILRSRAAKLGFQGIHAKGAKKAKPKHIRPQRPVGSFFKNTPMQHYYIVLYHTYIVKGYLGEERFFNCRLTQAQKRTVGYKQDTKNTRHKQGTKQRLTIHNTH